MLFLIDPTDQIYCDKRYVSIIDFGPFQEIKLQALIATHQQCKTLLPSNIMDLICKIKKYNKNDIINLLQNFLRKNKTHLNYVDESIEKTGLPDFARLQH